MIKKSFQSKFVFLTKNKKKRVSLFQKLFLSFIFSVVDEIDIEYLTMGEFLEHFQKSSRASPPLKLLLDICLYGLVVYIISNTGI